MHKRKSRNSSSKSQKSQQSSLMTRNVSTNADNSSKDRIMVYAFPFSVGKALADYESKHSHI